MLGPSAATAPTSATIAGDLQSELGCPGDWAPDCAATDLTPTDGGLRPQLHRADRQLAVQGGAEPLAGTRATAATRAATTSCSPAPAAACTFAFDPVTHWVADSVNALIVTAPGSYQSELGCTGDWQPDCLKTWLEDPDGDGVYTFETRSIPPGSYEAKAAINRSWDVNYGAGGAPGGANIAFTVSAPNQRVIFSFDSRTHVLSIQAGHGADGNVEWDGLRFDSRDSLYRAPQGAVPAGTPTTLRFRTFHDDVTSVTLRDYSTQDAAQQLIGMTRVASGVPCYQASLASETCDFWQATLPDTQVDVHWFRFIVSRRRLDGVLRRRHRGARRRPRRDHVDAARLELRADGLRPLVHDTGVGEERGRLPDLPGPVPERRHEERSEDGRRAVRPDRGQAPVERAARGVLPRLLHTVPAAVTVRRLQPGRPRRAAGPRLLRRRPEGRPPVARAAASARLQHDLPQPDLLVEVEPRLRHGRLQDDQPLLRDAEGVRPARAAGARAAHAHHPRRRLQPHVVGLAVLRPLPPFRDRRCVRVDVVRVPQLVRVHEHARAVHLGRLLGLVQLRLDPGARQVEPSGLRLLRRRAGQRHAHVAEARRGRLAARRDGRQLVPGRLLDALPSGREGDRSERTDRRRALAEGLDDAVVPRRPARRTRR